MYYIWENLCSFFTICFGHYFAVLVLSALGFLWIRGRKDRIHYVLVAGFFCTLICHAALRLHSSRYMLVPVLLSLPLIAWGAVAFKDFCLSRFRFGIWIFVVLAAVFALCSFLKFNRRSRNPRDAVVLRTVQMVREDFKKFDAGEALLLSNGDNAGLVLVYAGVYGKFHKLSAEQTRTFDSYMNLVCSKYPLIYILNESRPQKKRSTSGELNCDLHLPHGYKIERIDGGAIDSRGKYGKFELFRVESRCEVETDRARIDGFVGTPSRRVKNGDLSRWRECVLAPPAQLGNRFLARRARQQLPENWNIDFINRRGFDFADWSFAYEPPKAGTGHGTVRFHAADGGFALQSRDLLTVKGECRLKVAATAARGSKIMAFLYVYRKNRTFLTVQPVGVYRCVNSGDILLSFPLRGSSLPAEGAFFSVGLIGWQGDVALKKIDMVYDDDK